MRKMLSLQSIRFCLLLVAVPAIITVKRTHAFTIPSYKMCNTCQAKHQIVLTTPSTLFSKANPEEEYVQRTSFDQAGASLVDQEETRALDEMGDFDSIEYNNDDKVGQMRAAIKARTESLGLEKSQASVEYFEKKREELLKAGPPGANLSEDVFGGIDLSKISAIATGTTTKEEKSDWEVDLPSFFSDDEEELSKEEQEQVDPLMKESMWDQAASVISTAKWPTPLTATKRVVTILVVGALSVLLVVGWDKFLRQLYLDIGLVPTKEQINEYIKNINLEDLPPGWFDGANEEIITSLSRSQSIRVDPQ